MPRITIAQATPLSLPALSRLFAHAVRSNFTYFPQDVQQRVIREHGVPKLLLAWVDPRRILLTARHNGRIVGYAIGAVPPTGPSQLFWLYVDPEQRGANIGLSLLSRMLKLQAAKGAREVSIATHDHRRYYERQGFKFLRRATVDGVDLDILTFRITK
jgi:ribosomal protein S18 acetylase RimI-like enzyme